MSGNIFSEAAVLHRNQGIVVIAIAVLLVLSLVIMVAVYNWPSLVAQVQGISTTTQADIRFWSRQ